MCVCLLLQYLLQAVSETQTLCVCVLCLCYCSTFVLCSIRVPEHVANRKTQRRIHAGGRRSGRRSRSSYIAIAKLVCVFITEAGHGRPELCVLSVYF